MVAVIVGLKLTLLRNGMRRSTWRTIALVIALAYGLVLTAGAWIGLVALRGAPAWLAVDLTVSGFALLTVGWLMMSLLVFGSDETVDPARFALLPVPARVLQPGLFLAGLLGVPGLATTLIAFGLVATWSHGAIMIVGALIGALLGVSSCFLIARTATSAFSQALSSRRFRDFAAVAMALFGATIGLAINAITRATGSFSPEALRRMADDVATALGWTPFGWPWSIPAAVAQGNWGLVVIKLVLAATLVIALWFCWRYFLVRSLTSPLETGGGTRKASTGGWIDRLLPATPQGAIAARDLHYWRRDPRYLAAISGICIAPLIIIVTQLISRDGANQLLIAFAPVLISLLLGSVVTTDISYDGSALWTHISTGVSGAADRAGRAIATGIVVGPIVVIMTVFAAIFSGRIDLLPRVLALVLGLGLVGLGVGCWAGSVWQVPVPPPGANPFQRGNSGGLANLASTFASMGLTIAIGLPTIALVIASFWLYWLAYLAIAVGLISGVVALRVGISRGGARLDRTWPEVLTRVSATT